MPAEQSAASPSGAKENSKQSAENVQAGDDRKEPTSPSKEKTKEKSGEEASVDEASTDQKDDDAASRARQRQERFKALQARAKTATERNLKETAAETQRLATDPSLLSSLSRKHAFASHNLLKADTEAAGEDFERKRAWDWTVDESEKWDKRMEKKQRHRDNVAFQDYTQDARKVYKRQLREVQPDLETYEREKMAAIEKAAANGDLEIVETNDGEMIAVDKNGSFYSTADSVGFTENKPDRAAVDKLVDNLRKAEEVRLKKRRDRRGDDDGDVTYINEKNKQFNQKLSRFYNKYTTEIRDSFERGTMI
ncbi:pre-mRNA-splicing factor syf2 [Aspergillus niger]|uniref:Pre-mRNA-splicing factor SYF2 n=1 Tax=Aspergillus welwitschiae TaxID=1341132 RepID=A0A3F3Q393_9EURO|nr:SYF2 splicing factor-domain-containing protein [Aspergillus welwitschiae]GKZ71434.1 pre-mRNA-splicing factor syf2 [Aspergillus niger]RDH33452.1 SYF2 splicing factor-domain-containing protein [Aspergillus welwitschiae]GLA06967.1 pre-mRNA-splicing factor syf2 [Aspergillus niger]GLA13660.1 pre-mRNA-splicing factor syf2 [Aspergillus niger]GLA39017.1 pre-mRNA-splicing factor syf2 [Aspergillus niger]